MSPDDAVYMASEAERQEYVLNETGRIYIGSARSICGRPWNFGQVNRGNFVALATNYIINIIFGLCFVTMLLFDEHFRMFQYVCAISINGCAPIFITLIDVWKIYTVGCSLRKSASKLPSTC